MLTVHGRTRDMKGQKTGLADWDQIKAVKEAVKIPVIANGNIQYLSDVHRCLDITKVDAVMSAEGHLHNPALFSGLQPSAYTMSFEYLEFVEKYPTSIQIIRGHIFKLCHFALDEHSEFRPTVGSAQSIEEIKKALQKMQNQCSSCIGNSLTELPHPHWICQPYERPKLASELKNLENSVDSIDRSDIQEANNSGLNKRIMLTEQRRSRKAMKKEAKLAKKLAVIEGKLICASCNRNRKEIRDNCGLGTFNLSFLFENWHIGGSNGYSIFGSQFHTNSTYQGLGNEEAYKRLHNRHCSLRSARNYAWFLTLISYKHT
ncbi:unnamed protein product [Heterobilharzia americana]|nr:unnamed protein product [Heterobilharzia americana]